MKKILIIPPHKWYMEAQAEEIRKRLSDEFFIEIAEVPYEPYEGFLDRFPETTPFMRSPDEYDLIWPLLPTHWQIPQDKYAHKVVETFYAPNEGRTRGVAMIGATTPIVEQSLKDANIPYMPLRFGVDTDMFKPQKMIREDDLFHVGMVGTLYNPRRMTQLLCKEIKNISGVRLMLFLNQYPRNQKELDDIGCDLTDIVGGNVWWNGLPNIYNRLDVLVRCDQDLGYSFPVLEAAACGVPSIATRCGIDHYITMAGGGILIEGDRDQHMNRPQKTIEDVCNAIMYYRDRPQIRKLMAGAARTEIESNWTWDKHIDGWRQFFRKGLENAYTTAHVG